MKTFFNKPLIGRKPYLNTATLASNTLPHMDQKEPLLTQANALDDEPAFARVLPIDNLRPSDDFLLKSVNTRSEEQFMVIDHVIKPFLEWSYQEAFDLIPKTRYQKTKEMMALAGGTAIGGLSVASIYPLGGSFGDIVSDSLGIDNPEARTIIYGFFAINALIPMLCLSCVEAKDLFKKMASLSVHEKSISKQDRKNLRRGFACLAYVLAAFSALSPMYATVIAFDDSPTWVKWLTIPASFVGPLIFKAASELRLADRALNAWTPEEKHIIKLMRQQIKEKFSSALAIIKNMPDEKLDGLFLEVLQNGQDLQQDKQKQQQALLNLNRLASLPNNRSFVKDGPTATKAALPRQEKPSCFSSFWKGVGLFTGAASAYVYYTLAESAALYLCDYLQIEDEEARWYIQQSTSALAVIPWAALGAESTLTVFEKAYNFLRCKKEPSTPKPISHYSIATVAIFEGLCSATPPTYLAIQALNGTPWCAKLLIIPAFIGPAAIRTVAVSRLLEEGAAYIKTKRQDCQESKKARLLECVLKISAAIDKVPDKQLIHLYFELLKNHPSMFNQHDVKPGSTLATRARGNTDVMIDELDKSQHLHSSARRNSI